LTSKEGYAERITKLSEGKHPNVSGKDVDGLKSGKHYWTGDTHPEAMSLIPGQLVADNAYI
jgi:hypothetical protein